MIVARGQKAVRGDGLTIRVPAPAKHDRAALIDALGEILDRITPPARRANDR